MPSFNPCTGLIASPAPQRRIAVKPTSASSSSSTHYRRHSGRVQPPFSPGAVSPGNRRRKDIGDYWLGKTLGKGSSGRVKLGIHKVSGEKVAIKIISKSHLKANASVERAVKREIAVMKLIHHPNIMTLLDVIDLSDSPNLYLILEYVQGGELFEYLVSKGRLAEAEARKYFQQIIFGLDYCHRHLICHRDLKPENLLLDKDKNIKIADFGMASLQPTGSLLETSCGSPHYASPEIVTGIPYNGSASDIWSCGIILYALLCGHLPFDDDNIRELLNKVKIGKYKMPDHISLSARDLIQKILVIRPEKRLTMKEVQQHPWFTADPPPNPSILPDPPTAAEIGRPVSDASEIDDRLLETLKVLWTDLSTDQVIQALLNEEYNMQKVTYVLLQRHANNYWQIDRDDDLRSCESPAKRRRPATICGVASSNGIGSKSGPLPGIDDMMHKIVAKEKKPSQTNLFKHTNSPQSPLHEDRNVGDVDLPPPVPPKPIVIRADLIYNQARAEASASLKSPRLPQQWPYTPVQQQRNEAWRHPVSMASPSPHYRTSSRHSQPYSPQTSHPQVNPQVIEQHRQSYSPQMGHQQQFPHPVQQQHYYYIQHPYQRHMFPQQPQQHLHIGHMLSPRAPSTRVMQNRPSSYQQSNIAAGQQHQQHQHDEQQQPSKFNKLIHLWQRNRVEPVIKSPKATHRLSMPTPQTQLEFDRKQQHVLDHQQPHAPPPDSPRTYAIPPQVVHRPVRPSPRSPRHSTPAGSPRLSSWLPGLFHFKQPKVCSIDCIARDEREAIGKITQVLEECMEGTITERQDNDGIIRRKGEMTLPGNDTTTKSILLRFKVEVVVLSRTSNTRTRKVRVNFIQQQGDAVALMAAVRMVDRTLQAYEQEANLIATANGWTPQPSFT